MSWELRRASHDSCRWQSHATRFPTRTPPQGLAPTAPHAHPAPAAPAATCGNPVKLETENGVRVLGHHGVCSKPAELGFMHSVVSPGASVTGEETHCWVLCFILRPCSGNLAPVAPSERQKLPRLILRIKEKFPEYPSLVLSGGRGRIVLCQACRNNPRPKEPLEKLCCVLGASRVPVC